VNEPAGAWGFKEGERSKHSVIARVTKQSHKKEFKEKNAESILRQAQYDVFSMTK